MMNGLKKSDEAVRPVRAANKGARASAESPEERASTKGNPDCQSTRRTQCRVSVPQAAARIRKAAERSPKEGLTALFHHITPDALGAAYFALKKDAAAGVDGVTWDMYGEGLDERLLDLHRRLHRGGAYRAPPVRRVEIPKPDGGTRPLGIAALEDKVVQKAVVDVILTPIYEVVFLGFSYGFRPGRGARCARCPGLRDRTAQGQLDSRCRPPGVLRHDPAGLVDHVPSVPILTKVSQRACVLRFWGNDEDIGMHLAVSRGAGDAGRVGFWAEHAAEAGLAGTDRVAVG